MCSAATAEHIERFCLSANHFSEVEPRDLLLLDFSFTVSFLGARRYDFLSFLLISLEPRWRSELLAHDGAIAEAGAGEMEIILEKEVETGGAFHRRLFVLAHSFFKYAFVPSVYCNLPLILSITRAKLRYKQIHSYTSA